MALSLGPPLAPWPVPAFGGGTGLVDWRRRGRGADLLGWGPDFRDVMLASRDTVPVTSEGPLVSRCLGVSLSATTGFSVTAGNCAVKRSLVWPGG